MASKDLNIDIPLSVMIGDNITDVHTGHNAGCQFNILIGEPPEGEPCLATESLREAAELVLKMDILGGTPKEHDA